MTPRRGAPPAPHAAAGWPALPFSKATTRRGAHLGGRHRLIREAASGCGQCFPLRAGPESCSRTCGVLLGHLAGLCLRRRGLRRGFGGHFAALGRAQCILQSHFRRGIRVGGCTSVGVDGPDQPCRRSVMHWLFRSSPRRWSIPHPALGESPLRKPVPRARAPHGWVLWGLLPRSEGRWRGGRGVCPSFVPPTSKGEPWISPKFASGRRA